MKQELTGFQRFTAILAKWIVVNIAMRISPLAVLSLCLEVSRKYYESSQIEEE
jgi:hypothetical protein